jgi:hypothetical protein
MPIDTATQFCVLAVAQGSDAYTLIVSFTKPPLAVSSMGATDALNPNNYSLTGVTSPAITAVVPLSTSMFSLALGTAIQSGTYNLAVANVMSGSYGLEAPTSVTFLSSAVPKEILVQGNSNDTALDTLRRWLPPLYRYKLGWEALLSAIAAGDDYVRQNAYVAFNQVFLSTSIGSYLVQKASDYGVKYPAEVGMSDDRFRTLAIQTTERKIVSDSLSKILEVFYGENATRANATSSVVPTNGYNITPNDTITFVFDNTNTVSVQFISSDFSLISQAQPSEVAAVMTRAFRAAGLLAFAKATTQETGTAVTVYSGSLGLAGSVEVTGGMAQNTFQFPTRIPLFDTLPTTPTWYCIRTSPTEFRLTWNTSDLPTPPDPYLIANLANVQIGDYVLLDFANLPPLRNSYEVSDVHFDVDGTGNAQMNTWFSVIPPADFSIPIGSGGDIVQTALNEIVFYRVNRETVSTAINPSFIAQHVGGSLDVILPVTTQAVERSALDAAYLHINSNVGGGITEYVQAPPPPV